MGFDAIMGGNESKPKKRGVTNMFAIRYSPLNARFWESPYSHAWPDVDIVENSNEYIFSIEIPGAMKDDIKIWLNNGVLTVSGEKKSSAGDDQTALVSERSFGKFERSFRLPESVDRKNVKADFVDGVLVVTLPKVPEAKPQEVSIK
jgi:HSP20 family protein